MNSPATIEQKLKKDYWIAKLTGIEDVTDGALVKKPRGSRKKTRTEINGTLATRVAAIAGNNPAVELIIYLSFFNQLLSRCLNVRQLLVAAPSGENTMPAEKEDVVFFKLSYDGQHPVKDQFVQVRNEVQESLRYGSCDYNGWQRQLSLHGIAVGDLFRYVFSFNQADAVPEMFDQAVLRLNICRTDGSYEAMWECDQSAFDNLPVARLAEYYITLLTDGIGKLNAAAGTLALLPEEQRLELLSGYNTAIKSKSGDLTIQALFESNVRKYPDVVALDSPDETLTYAQLNVRANKLAAYLRHTAGVRPDDLVGLMVERSSWWIIGMLGILKAGGAYLPLDPAAPGERTTQMLSDAAPVAVLTHSDFLFSLDYYQGNLCALDIQLPDMDMADTDPEPVNKATDLAYVMYTSGSTGMPKGVMITHKGVVRLVKHTNYIKLSPADRLLVTGAITFDATTFEVWGMLLNGGRLYLLPAKELADHQVLKDTISREKITVCWFTASWFNQLADYDTDIFKPLTRLLIGGERLSVAHVNKIKTALPSLKIINGYGPTENTTFSVCGEIKKMYTGDIPLGTPISNTAVYILDEYLQPSPPGVTGDIYLSGDGLARGYLHRTELTAAKFIDNPFADTGKMYKTGDRGYWRTDRQIAFAGREDAQVKVRGYRIEPGETEHALLKIDGVKEAVVLHRTAKDGNNELMAFYVPASGAALPAIREKLAGYLPAYMIPAAIIAVDAIPLTPNGKTDRAALLQMQEKSGNVYVAPRNATEEEIVAIWQEVLEKGPVGVTDNFFEAGGHSLKATQVISRIYETTGVKIDLGEMFMAPTVEALAAMVEQSDKKQFAAIDPVAEQPFYELSHAQRRLWILHQLEENGTTYNMPMYYALEQVDLPALEKAICTLVERHESLRTAFPLVDGKPRQKINNIGDSGFRIIHTDLSGQDNRADLCKRLAAEEIAMPFDLEKGPPLRVKLIHMGEGSYVLLFNMHHIVSDGWSIKVMTGEIIQLYHAFRNGAENPLPPLRIQYKDYAAWQQKRLNDEMVRIQQQFWHGRFKGELPVLDLPADFPRSAVKTHHGDCIRITIDPEKTAFLNNISRQQGATLFMTLLATVKALLYKYTGQEDIIIGSPIAGRDHKDLENQIGFYVNTLALRTKFYGDRPFSDLLEEVKKNTLDAYRHQLYPFDRLVDELDLNRDLSRSPLFDVMVVLLNIDGNTSPETADHTSVTTYAANTAVSKFDITMGYCEVAGGISLSLEYNTDLFLKDRMERMVQHYLTLLQSLMQQEGRPLKELDILPVEEKQLLLHTFNNTKSPYKKTGLCGLFEAQVRRTPQAIAVADNNMTLTYREVDEQANRIAAYLKEHAGDTGLAGVMLERSALVPGVLLGILKAGLAYVPVDPRYPAERIAFMLEDSDVQMIITQQSLEKNIPAGRRTLVLDANEDWKHLPVTAPEKTPRGQDPAYIIYTSGSTGKPKGIIITHKNLSAFLHWSTLEFATSRYDVLLAVTSYCFDLSVFEMFFPLITGKTVRILESALDISRWLQCGRQLLVNTVPSVIEGLLKEKADLSAVTVLNMAGEPAPATFRHELDFRRTEIRNLYGPSEDTTYSTFYRFADDHYNFIPIGKPIANTSVYILDEQLALLPVGIKGEICLAGDGLAKGYHNRKKLTAQKFIRHPLVPGGRLYLTGDLGRWDSHGNLEYLGRKDSQVKVRGYRIEPGEIEHALAGIEGVEKAVVLVKEELGRAVQIIAFYTGTGKLTVDHIRNYLGARLPAYMVPSQYFFLPEIPLTPNGKTDRQYLLQLETRTANDISYVPPRDETERQLAAIWGEILGRKTGIRDNFFAIGGDSIKAIQVISRLYEQGHRITMKEIFRYPEVALLAPHIKQLHEIADQAPVTGEVLLSPIQRAFFDAGVTGRHHYNQALMISAPSRLQKEAIQAVFTEIQNHHDALRITFRTGENKITAFNHGPDMHLALEEHDWSDESQEDATIKLESRAAEMQAGIDMEHGPLMKLGLFHLPDGDRLLIVVHHLVIDGVSWRILSEDLETLYQQYLKGVPLKLPLKTHAFKAWSAALAAAADTPLFQDELSYWQQQQFNGNEIIPDFSDGGSLVKDTAACRFELNDMETEQLLTTAHRAFNTEINDLLLAALGLAVRKVFRLEKVLIDLEGHGREEIFESLDISRTIGWFTTLYPVMLDTSPQDNTAWLIKSTKESLRRIPGKGVGYGVLKYLSGQRPDFSGKAAFLFNYLGQFDQDIKRSTFEVASEYAGPMQDGGRERTHDFDISGMVAGGKLAVTISYSAGKYRTTTVQQLGEAYLDALSVIVRYCVSREVVSPTPSDFTFKELDIATIDELSAAYAPQDICNLSPMQGGMLFEGLYNGHPNSYNNQTAYRIAADLSPLLVAQSLSLLSARHDVIRTAIVYEQVPIPLQLVLKDRKADFYYEDLRTRSAEERETFIADFKIADQRRAFDLTAEPLLRLALLQVGDQEYECVWSFHHIIMDGWCISILVKEFTEIYESLATGRQPRLLPAVPYRSYISWLNKQSQEQASLYWKNYLSGWDTLTVVPRMKALHIPRRQHHRSVIVALEGTAAERLQALSAGSRITPNTFVHAVWGILLSRYNNNHDAVFGSVVSGRPSQVPGVETMVGLFINSVPVRISYSPELTFNELVVKMQENAIEAGKYHYLPLGEIQRLSSFRTGLFDHLVNFENYPVGEQIAGLGNQSGGNSNATDISLSKVEFAASNPYDFMVIVNVWNGLRVEFKYTDAYHDDYVNQIATQFLMIAEQVLENIHISIGEINILSDGMKTTLLESFNNTTAEYPQDAVIHELFEAQAGKTPDHPAVVTDGQTLSYSELNLRANRLAHHLRTQLLVQPGDMVGVLTERSAAYLIAVLAILKAGGAYVPIDTAYPAERIRYILGDVQPEVLIAPSTPPPGASYPCRHLLALAEMPLETGNSDNLPVMTVASDLAYVMYTSGSTGIPKGVMISNRNVIRLVKNTNYITLDEEVKLLATGALSFDASTFEIWGTLLNGGELHLCPQHHLLDTAVFKSRVLDTPVTVMWLTASWFNQLVDTDVSIFSKLKYLLVGGEQLSPAHIGKVKTACPDLRVINGYGPTENTTFSICGTVEEAGTASVPLGFPIANSTVYILDEALQPAPLGIPGEIYTGGDGVAAGYLHQPELTARKFIPDPFRAGGRLYKTGDYGKWLPDGRVEFIGRKDDQVKIRGYRIELQEIANVVRQHAGVEDACVLATAAGATESRLAAVLILREAKGEEAAVLQDVRRFTAAKLPGYMVPVSWHTIAQFPLTVNGKTDMSTLEKQLAEMPAPDTEVIMPRNAMEEHLAEIWKELLGKDSIGVNEDFFALGGHSLRATQLIARIAKTFDVKIDVRTVFMYPTIQQLSDEIKKASPVKYETIPVAPVREYYELSHAQKRLWVLDAFEESKTAYHVPGAFVLTGKVNTVVLEQAFNALIARHESLRTVFVSVNGEPKQKILPAGNTGFVLDNVDLSGEEKKAELALSLAAEESVRPFNLSAGPLLRVKLLQMDDEQYVFLFNMHHIISDGWSMQVLIREVVAMYHAYCEGREPELPVLNIQHKDVVAWQYSGLTDKTLLRHQEYWWGIFRENPPVLELPADYNRPAVKTYNGSVYTELMDKVCYHNLKTLAHRYGVSVFMVLEAMAKTLFFRYTGQEDITLGAPAAGRNHPELEHQIGFYINTLALRTQFSGNDSFVELLQQVKHNTLEAYKYQEYPFDRLVDDLELPWNPGRSPVFDVMIVLQNLEEYRGGSQPGDINISGYPVESVTSQFDLTLIFKEMPEGLLLSLEYNTGLFSIERMKRLCGHFRELVRSVCRQPELPLNKLNYLTDDEQHQLLQVFSHTPDSYTVTENVVSLFEEQVRISADSVAVVDGEKILTYQQLNEQAEKIAAYLKYEAGVNEGDLVGVMMDRSWFFVSALLGILKAGAAYFPLSAGYPPERLRYMLDDARPVALLTQSDYLFGLSGYQGALFAADIQLDGLHTPESPVNVLPGPRSLAYVMYTSGTTGNPRGVAIEHRSIVRLVKNTNYVTLDASDRLLQTGALSFDATTFEIWGMLLNGGTLQLLSDEKLLNMAVLKETILREQITVMWLTSSWFNQLLDEDMAMFAPLQKLLVGGEKLSPRHINRLREQYPALEIINGYGPTENTTFSICYNIRTVYENDIPLGYPVTCSSVYILDRAGYPVPVGVDGEIYLGGEGLARGYINNEALTAERFVTVPLLPGVRLYKTGDAGRWTEEGKVLFSGRKDDQLKIRGYRIEPAETEQVLMTHEKIEQAAVTGIINDKGELELAAFLVPVAGGLDINDVRAFLGKKLPVYMMPATIMVVDSIPLTANGKTDKKALQQLAAAGVGGNRASGMLPRDYFEQQLAVIWEEVLRCGNIFIDDDFFELGGHSLKAAQVVSRVYKQFEVNIDLAQLFLFPTIRQLAERIRQESITGYTEITRQPDAPWYPVSAGQKRLWVLNQLEAGEAAYNMGGAYELEGDFFISVLERVFTTLIARHEILRTSFKMVDGELMQIVCPVEEVNFKVICDDLTNNSDQERQAGMLTDEHMRRPFDLSNGPLIRVKVLRLGENRNICVFAMHHIISDGWSLKVLMRELDLLYEAYRLDQDNPLPPLRIQYRDYAAWHLGQIRSGELDKHRRYAALEFENAPVLQLPTDYPRPEVRTNQGSRLVTSLDPELSRQLSALAKVNGCSLFMTLLAALNAVLYRYTGQRDIVIGTVDAGRIHPDLEDQIGFYINTLAIRTRFSGDDTFGQLLENVRNKVLQAYKHAAYPFDMLLTDLGTEWDRSHSPLFDVVLSLQNTDVDTVTSGMPAYTDPVDAAPLQVKGYKTGLHSSVFDLIVNVNETPDGLVCSLVYDTNLFREEFIQAFTGHFISMLNSMVSDPQCSINVVPLIPESAPPSGADNMSANDYEFNF